MTVIFLRREFSARNDIRGSPNVAITHITIILQLVSAKAKMYRGLRDILTFNVVKKDITKMNRTRKRDVNEDEMEIIPSTRRG